MKSTDVKSNSYFDSSKEIKNKGPKFNIGDAVRISKYKNIFAKVYILNWSDEIFVIKKVKNIVLWTYVINDPNRKAIVETFYEKKCRKESKII